MDKPDDQFELFDGAEHKAPEDKRFRHGSEHPNYGRIHSDESREKRRQWMLANAPNRGKPKSEETKQKLREARKRQIHPQFKVRGFTEEVLVEAAAKGLKWCAGECKAFIPSAEFASVRVRACRKCIAAGVANVRANWTPEQHAESVQNIKRWRSEHPGYETRYRLLRHYGVTVEWYEETLAAQNGVCALCFSDKSRHSSKNFCVDHNHQTGKVRGLLCAKCNTALERFESDPEWPARAHAYLAKYS